MSRRLVDVTQALTNEEEYDFTGSKYFDSFDGKFFKENPKKKNITMQITCIYGEMDRRRIHALKLFKEEPNKTVFDVARISLLPVRVVRQLKDEFNNREEWLQRSYLGEDFED